MQKEMKQTKEKSEVEKEIPSVEEAVPCWSNYFADGAAVEADGSVVAHRRWLQAGVLLFQAAERDILTLPLSSSFLFFFLFFRLPVVCPFVLPVFFFKFPPLFQASPCSFLPLSVFCFFSFYSLRPLSLLVLFFSSFCAGFGWYL